MDRSSPKDREEILSIICKKKLQQKVKKKRKKVTYLGTRPHPTTAAALPATGSPPLPAAAAPSPPRTSRAPRWIREEMEEGGKGGEEEKGKEERDWGKSPHLGI